MNRAQEEHCSSWAEYFAQRSEPHSGQKLECVVSLVGFMPLDEPVRAVSKQRFNQIELLPLSTL